MATGNELYLQPDVKTGPVTHGDRAQDMHRGDLWRQPHKIRPIETAPLTAMGDLMGSKKSVDHRFAMTIQPHNAGCGPVGDVFTDPQLSTAYVSGATDGTELFIGLSRQAVDGIRVGNTLMLHSLSTDAMRMAYVTSLHRGGDTDSYVAVQLFQDDDDDALANNDLSYTIVSYSAPEKNQAPEGQYEEVKRWENFTQELQEAVSFTRREINSAEEVAGPNIEARGFQQALVRLDRIREYTRFLGVKRDKGGGETLTGGLYYWLSQLLPTHVISYVNDTTFVDRPGQRFEIGGYQFWRNIIVDASRYYTENQPMVAFCGGQALEAIQQSFGQLGQFTLNTTMSKIGLRVMTLQGLARDIKFTQHPLFASNPALERAVSLTVPKYCMTRHHQGLGLEIVKPGQRTGRNYSSVDTHMVRTDEGMQIENMLPFYWVSGNGLDNLAA